MATALCSLLLTMAAAAAAGQKAHDLSALQTRFSIGRSLPRDSGAAASSGALPQDREALVLRIRYLETLASKQSRRLADFEEELLGEAGDRPRGAAASGMADEARLDALETGLVAHGADAAALLSRTRAAVQKKMAARQAQSQCDISSPCRC